MTLGEQLTKLRKKKGLSQEDVAEKLNVTRQTVSKWELDQSLPDFDKIVPISELYEISTDELLKGDQHHKESVENYYEGVSPDYIRKERGKAICISLIIFIIAIGFVVIGDELNASDGVIATGFLLISTIGVVNIIYRFVSLPRLNSKSYYGSENKITVKEMKERNSVFEHIKKITTIIFLMIYLGYSFATHMWHKSWIIWIIYALVIEIEKLIFNIREDD